MRSCSLVRPIVCIHVGVGVVGGVGVSVVVVVVVVVVLAAVVVVLAAAVVVVVASLQL